MRFDIRLAVVFVVAGLTGFYWGLGDLPSIEQSLAFLRVPAPVADIGPFVADNRVKAADCQAVGGLPDHECTPGAVFPNITAEQTCVSGYTKTVRSVSVSLKKEIYKSYGIAYPPPFGSFEADHFIPLALGGNNDIANLFPEAAEPKPGFREKDLVENYLHEQVCSGKISLSNAQRAIATNWIAVYKSMSPSIIAELKSKYASWSKTGD
jgi:hypothetical protein